MDVNRYTDGYVVTKIERSGGGKVNWITSKNKMIGILKSDEINLSVLKILILVRIAYSNNFDDELFLIFQFLVTYCLRIKQKSRPLGRDNFLQKHPEMSPQPVLYPVTNEFHIL
jgi:hypothetical protein